MLIQPMTFRRTLEMPVLLATLLFVLATLLSPSTAVAQADTPKLGVVAQRVSQALGGQRGGMAQLERAGELDFVFVREVRDSWSRKPIVASHRLLRMRGGAQLRLDVRVSGDEGVDSASVIDDSAAWVLAEDEKHDADPAALRSRLAEFSPERLFAVPLSLADGARDLLFEVSLRVTRQSPENGGQLVLVGEGDDAGDTRIVLDANYRPVEVAFRSLSGPVIYRYDDYREVAPGLIIPFIREFHRNGKRVERTTVRRFWLHARTSGDLFNPEKVKLGPLPQGP